MKQLKFGGESLIIGKGSIEYLNNIKASRVFIVTGGNSMFKNGTIDKICEIFKKNDCCVEIFSGIPKNPGTDIILNGVSKMKEFKPEIVLALGGGSPMDASKVMALFYENEDINFSNVLKITLPQKRKKLKLIAVSTTSGTGSEVTKAAVVTFKDIDLKIGLKSDLFIFDIAILDSDLTLTMPKNVVAETGMDALTHAVECYINKDLDDFTEALAARAVEGLFEYLPISFLKETQESREKVHNYQCMAGLAFSNVGLGMAHGISHALGGMFNMGHGLSNAIVLPYVLKFNSQDENVKDRLDMLAKKIGSTNFIESVKELNIKLNIPVSIKASGIKLDDFNLRFETLVENSMQGATKVNPITISKEEMRKLLKDIYYGV